MRVAIVSDIHGSLHALEAVVADLRRQGPDVVIHGGDLVLSGGRPADVVDAVRGLGWPGVVGNTEELLWRPEEMSVQTARIPRLGPLLRILFESFAPATAEMLGEDRIAWLRTLAAEQRIEDVTVVHAAPGDLWRAPGPNDSDESFTDTYSPLGSRVVVYGHIHRPFVRRVAEMWVANSGSAGMSYDGDPRASYALVDGDDVRIRRVTFDIERDIADLNAAKYPFAPWLAEVRRNGRYTPPPNRANE